MIPIEILQHIENTRMMNWGSKCKSDLSMSIILHSFFVCDLDYCTPHTIDVVTSYHEVFRLLFTPSAFLADRVDSTMKSLDLQPLQYSSVHLRVKYPRYGIDAHKKFEFQEHKSMVIDWAINAVNCAVELHPNSTIYVSSDNNDTIGYLLEESPFAQHYIDATRLNEHPVVKLVARDYSMENAHIAFTKNEYIDGYMNVFEDLIIMGMGKCVAHGLGGYGRLGAALSGGECVVTHRGDNSKICSDALMIKI